ncbi:MAG: hypothetical protein AAGE59_19300, partial [Cyanobacteria bacterium P01_F01_bin.86]
ERLALFSTLSQLPEPQFEQLVFALNVPRGNLSSSASQSSRVSQLLGWAESIGCGLDELRQVLRQVMGRQD